MINYLKDIDLNCVNKRVKYFFLCQEVLNFVLLTDFNNYPSNH